MLCLMDTAKNLTPTKLEFIDKIGKVQNEANIKDVLLFGFLEAAGEEKTRELFKHYLKSVKPRSPEGRVVTVALDGLEELAKFRKNKEISSDANDISIL